MISILEKLLQLRHQKVNTLISQLAQQKKICLIYEKNINDLLALSNGKHSINSRCSALKMANMSNYKKNIQGIINWQEQEKKSEENKIKKIQTSLKQESCQEKIVQIILEKQQQKILLEQIRKERKIADGIASQSWSRNHTK